MLWPDVLSHDIINLTNVYISSEMDARRFEVGETFDSFGLIFRRQDSSGSVRVSCTVVGRVSTWFALVLDC